MWINVDFVSFDAYFIALQLVNGVDGVSFGPKLLRFWHSQRAAYSPSSWADWCSVAEFVAKRIYALGGLEIFYALEAVVVK